MMNFQLLLLCIFVSSTLAADESARVTNLPNLTFEPTFRHYSGFLKASGTRLYHYWFVESKNDPASDPLVLWLNGGPGASSLIALLTEHGPFMMQTNNSVIDNPYAWNKRANVIYLESPAGVGYSMSLDKNYTCDDDQTSLENYNSLLDFFTKFPEYKDHDLFIAGESYGGIYVPTLTLHVVANKNIKLKGMIVGNGMSDYRLQDASFLYYLYYHGLFDSEVWHKLLTNCKCAGKERCIFADSKNARCQDAIDKGNDAIAYINPYNIYDRCFFTNPINNPKMKTSKYLSSSPFADEHRKLLQSAVMLQKTSKRNLGVPPCLMYEYITKYMNLPSVRKALHIPGIAQAWSPQFFKIPYRRVYKTMTDQYRVIMMSDIRVLIYNGDIDTACNYLGEQWFFDDLKYPLDYSGKQWYINTTSDGRRVGGVSKSYAKGQLLFTTVRGAGHMVPSSRPKAAVHLIDAFLMGRQP